MGMALVCTTVLESKSWPMYGVIDPLIMHENWS
jgi:hypothetical protein